MDYDRVTYRPEGGRRRTVALRMDNTYGLLVETRG